MIRRNYIIAQITFHPRVKLEFSVSLEGGTSKKVHICERCDVDFGHRGGLLIAAANKNSRPRRRNYPRPVQHRERGGETWDAWELEVTVVSDGGVAGWEFCVCVP